MRTDFRRHVFSSSNLVCIRVSCGKTASYTCRLKRTKLYLTRTLARPRVYQVQKRHDFTVYIILPIILLRKPPPGHWRNNILKTTAKGKLFSEKNERKLKLFICNSRSNNGSRSRSNNSNNSSSSINSNISSRSKKLQQTLTTSYATSHAKQTYTIVQQQC